MWKPNKLIRRLLLCLAAIIVALVVAEFAARVLLPRPQRVMAFAIHGPGKGHLRPGRRDEQITLARNPEEGHLYTPTRSGRRLFPMVHVVIEDHHLSDRRIEIKTNSLGYRNRELSAKTGPRILFLGDSITLGDYLPEDETFVRLVESMARTNGKPWETVNAGVGAISLKNEIAILLETGLHTQPDAVVLGFYLNDFQESPGVEVWRPPQSLAWSRLLTHVCGQLPLWWYYRTGRGERLRRALTEGADLMAWREEFKKSVVLGKGDFRKSREAFNTLLYRRFESWGAVWSSRTWTYMRPLFEELKRQSVANRFRLFIVVFPVSCQVEAEFLTDYPQQQLAALCKSLEIPLLDLLPKLRAEWAAHKKPLFYDRCHHTPYGSRFVADAIYGFLDAHDMDGARARAKAGGGVGR